MRFKEIKEKKIEEMERRGLNNCDPFFIYMLNKYNPCLPLPFKKVLFCYDEINEI